MYFIHAHCEVKRAAPATGSGLFFDKKNKIISVGCCWLLACFTNSNHVVMYIISALLSVVYYIYFFAANKDARCERRDGGKKKAGGQRKKIEQKKWKKNENEKRKLERKFNETMMIWMGSGWLVKGCTSGK